MPKIEHPTSPIPGALQGLHLFHFDGALCAQRVRFALGEKGLARGSEEKFDSTTPTAVAGESGRWVSRIVSLVRKDHMTQTEIFMDQDSHDRMQSGNLMKSLWDIKSCSGDFNGQHEDIIVKHLL